ncbi:MAG: shikimate kinase [Myxococcaceae bacterium]
MSRRAERMPEAKTDGEGLLGVLGARVRALREGRGQTRKALAEQTGISERFLSDLEAGRGNISVVNLSHVASALGVTAAELLAVEQKGSDRGVIALLGLRGAGKSTIGKALASKLGVHFFELDRLVEAEAGMSLAEIFAMHGEGYYRDVERRALERFLAQNDRAVLATGGGLVTSPEAFHLLIARTRTIWLKATPEEHWNRVVEQGDTRPMANRPSAMAELKRRLKEREPLYSRAELTISTTGRTVNQVVSELVGKT